MLTNKPIEEQTTELDPDQVAQYLQRHPDFFIDYEKLLSELVLPHHTGEHAISLVERQVSVLRTRNRDVRSRLNRLLETARDNDRLFHTSRKLVLELIDQTTVDSLSNTMLSGLRDDFQIDTCSLILVTQHGCPSSAVRQSSPEDIQRAVGALLHSRQPVCGHLRPAETQFLFPDAGNPVQSAAVVQLMQDDALLGLLAIGSFDPDMYRSGSGTLFLGYLSDVLNRLLLRLLSV